MSDKDYPITFGYGATDDTYYGPKAQGKSTYIGPYHRGDDREMPIGTPVIVNGVTIGLSGNGGGRYGAHLHVGKFINGKDVNPNSGGFDLDGAKVIAVVDNYGSDPVNAKYIRIQDGSAAQWLYLHMSEVYVSVGQVLMPQETDEMIQDAAHLNAMTQAWWGRSPTQDETNKYVGKVTYSSLAEQLDASAEYANKKAADADAYEWKKNATAPGKGVTDIAELQDALNWKKTAINDFIPQITELKKELGGSDKAEQILNDMQATLNKYRS